MKDYSTSEIELLAKYAADSGLYAPLNVPQCFQVILRGQELGIGASQALMELRVIKGKLTLSAATIGAMIQRSPKYSYSVLKLDEQECSLRFFDDSEVSGESSFTLKDAKAAGIYNPMYEKYARNMLFARALTNGARWYCPEVFGGAVYTPDELKGAEEVPPSAKGYIENAIPPENSQESEKAQKKPYQLREVAKPAPEKQAESFIAVDFDYFNGMTSDEILEWGKENSARMSEKDLTTLRKTIREHRTIEHSNRKLNEKRAAIATNSIDETLKVQGEV